ncbi:MAG: acyl-CoA dehydrogenase domain-containing protein, partial [Rhodanobacteraceae bacterium]
LTAPNSARDALVHGIYLTQTANNPVGRMHALLPEVVAAEPVERKFLKAVKAGNFKAHDYLGELAEAEQNGAITAAERVQLERLRKVTAEFINVDDFDPEELRAAVIHGGKDAKRSLHVA